MCRLNLVKELDPTLQIALGYIGADLIALASMLRIPVYMHNVPEENIFRPHTWAAFGANEPQGADFRACALYGSLYDA